MIDLCTVLSSKRHFQWTFGILCHIYLRAQHYIDIHLQTKIKNILPNNEIKCASFLLFINDDEGNSKKLYIFFSLIFQFFLSISFHSQFCSRFPVLFAILIERISWPKSSSKLMQGIPLFEKIRDFNDMQLLIARK